jgi:hypothetical protein
MTLCAVCTVHKKTSNTSFLVEPQNKGRRFISGLTSKWLGRFVSGLTSKPLVRFLSVWPQNLWWRFLSVWSQNRWLRISQFGPQIRQLRFSDLGLKITATVSCFVTQNHVGDGLSVASQNWWREDSTWHTLRSVSLLQLEASRARVFQFARKTSGCTTTCGSRGIIAEVHREKAKDRWVHASDCVGPFYLKITVFNVLDRRGVIVFFTPINRRLWGWSSLPLLIPLLYIF